MKYKVRVGNDLPVQWSFFQDKAKTVPLNLSGRTLSVYLSTNTSKWKLSDLTVENNWIGFTIPGVDQISKYGTGLFNLTCIENEGESNQHVIDFISPFLFVSQLEVSQSGGVAETDYTVLESGTAYLESAYLSYFETIDHAEATYQKKLVSGENIKTVNGQTLLGEGNLDVQNIFLAIYGSTTYKEIIDALAAGKSVLCKLPTDALALYDGSGQEVVLFSGITRKDGNVYQISVGCNSSDEWALSGVTAYTKPQGGIPELDLAEAVRLKLTQGRGFYVQYGSTSYNQVLEAFQEGRLLICWKDSEMYCLQGVTETEFVFFNVTDFTCEQLTLEEGDTWTSEKKVFAEDSKVVHLEGEETISGDKEFSGEVKTSEADWSKIVRHGDGEPPVSLQEDFDKKLDKDSTITSEEIDSLT